MDGRWSDIFITAVFKIMGSNRTYLLISAVAVFSSPARDPEQLQWGLISTIR